MIEAGPQWTMLTGMTEEKSLGWGWAKALHPADVEKASREWRQSVETGAPVDMEYRVRNKAGRWQWMRARAAARLNSEGKVVRWYGWLEDIDHQKRAKAELEDHVARLQAIFEAAPVGLVVAEAPSGRMVMSNRQAEMILGQTVLEAAEEVREWELFDHNGRRVESQEDPLQRAIRHGETTAGVYRYDRQNGTKVWVSISAAAIRSTTGKIIGGVMTLQDAEAVHDSSLLQQGLRA